MSYGFTQLPENVWQPLDAGRTINGLMGRSQKQERESVSVKKQQMPAKGQQFSIVRLTVWLAWSYGRFFWGGYLFSS